MMTAKKKKSKKDVKNPPSLSLQEIIWKFEDARSLVILAKETINNNRNMEEIGHAATALTIGEKMLDEVSDSLDEYEGRGES